VEFDIPGVTQIPVDTTRGQSFADNVRTILRLDPDVVMVGEIRDTDTAKTAVQAAITGHLLLATFHAQDAAAAFARFVDMIGINPVFTTAIRLVIGQRLVRRLDPETRIEYEPDEMTKAWIRKTLADLPETTEKPNLDNIRLYRPGKSDSNPFGYSGRIVLMEQLIMNDEIAKFISGDVADVNANEIAKTARRHGMVSMLQKGVIKALQGETTLEEVNRVL
ncbi:MAG: ATPase, T2SS/T4P/T4SS family, partial [Candidatus Saccharibacteria bacterium]|nr:ATPase, T2SS/T4P/T4SS family [Candidatus Saccharibacteria bacterium]